MYSVMLVSEVSLLKVDMPSHTSIESPFVLNFWYGAMNIACTRESKMIMIWPPVAFFIS